MDEELIYRRVDIGIYDNLIFVFTIIVVMATFLYSSIEPEKLRVQVKFMAIAYPMLLGYVIRRILTSIEKLSISDSYFVVRSILGNRIIKFDSIKNAKLLTFQGQEENNSHLELFYFKNGVTAYKSIALNKYGIPKKELDAILSEASKSYAFSFIKSSARF